ncbi:MAG TPA: translation initiation factor IF-2 [Gaiellales bacterium]|nr:translation initiation factor IF-2 [Gaiellales bacterium]
MAKKTVTDIAREQGVSEAEVKQKLDEAGAAAPAADDLVDDDDVRRAFGVKATVPAQEPGQPARHARPQRGAQPGRRRRVVIDSQAGRRPGQKRDRSAPRPEAKREPEVPTGPVKVESGVTVKDLAEKLGISATKIITYMMNQGQMVTLTVSLSDDDVQLIGLEFDREVIIQHAADEEEAEEVTYDDPPESLLQRPPVVTIMGHVDHGKTTLLDAIRESSVVETEAGGITQHIGAYQVDVDGRKVTFLDTPGHEAFTAMRARGAKVTDVAVLVVAADDGVMPQTVEAIDHAKAAEVPIVVAVNKIDKEDANPERVRGELVNQGLQPEEWGGETIFVDVSAKAKQNLDQLLEMLLLQADVLELKANPKSEASGVIIESRLDVGRGPVATLLVQRGTLRVGDAVVAGDAWGRVKALNDANGKRVKEAGPAVPVEILGFDKPPPAGEFCRVVENDRVARQLAQKRAQRIRTEMLARRSKAVSLEDLFSAVQEGAVQELGLIIKADVQGSVEAAEGEIAKIQHPEVTVSVIHSGVGGITASDINLAAASNAIVVGFNVRPNAEAKALAEREGVDIRTYRVIYQLTEDIQQALIGMLAPEQVEEVIGELEVRQTFKVSRLGTIAGCMVTSGMVTRGAQVRLIRDGTIVHDGRIGTLRRFQDDVREVQQGFECGVTIDGYNDVKEGDVLEVYTVREVARTA